MTNAFGFKSTTILRTAVLGLVFLSVVSAGTINLSTVAADPWLITGAGATNAAAKFQADNSISITSTALSGGTFVTGGTLANFDGFWVATLSFTLPVGATAPSLSFSGFGADDRAVLELNGVIIGESSAAGAGSMSLTDVAATAFTFAGPASGTMTTGFNAAGVANTLTIIVNNTNTGITGATRTFQSPTADFTGAILTGSFTFTDAAGVPEPASASFLLLGLAPLAYWLRKKRSC